MPLTIAVDESIWQLFLLQDYNTRVVLMGTVLLGIAAGMLGVFMLLRQRALIGDAISHATLPGVALAFLITTALGVEEKSLFLLLCGAAISGGLGGLMVLGLRHFSQIREDAALGIVLSVFFGAGVALVTLVQQVPGGNAAGLEAFIYGKAASMTSEDAWLIVISALAVLLITLAFYKELKLLCFDAQYARSQGWPVLLLDTLLIALVVCVTILGLQAVGLFMIIALQVVPSASARFWTHKLNKLILIAAVVGAGSCAIGTLLSATYDRLPTGATIVICSCTFFVFSFFFGAESGLYWRLGRRRSWTVDTDQQHLLRVAFEILESSSKLPRIPEDLRTSPPLDLDDIRDARGWSYFRLRSILKSMQRSGLIITASNSTVQLTPKGLLQAIVHVREHRLLEGYMMREAAVGVREADKTADYFEHALQPEHLAKLFHQLSDGSSDSVPPNPHEAGFDP